MNSRLAPGSTPRRRPAGRWERGSVSVLAAAVMMVSASVALASVDLLRALDARDRAQAAADAAALAAARELALPSGRDPAEAAADYAARNRATVLECDCVPGSSEAVVVVQVTVDLVFVGGDRPLTARARAVVDDGVSGAARGPPRRPNGPPPVE